LPKDGVDTAVECAIDLEECVEVGGMAFAGSVWDVMGDHEEELERESGGRNCHRIVVEKILKSGHGRRVDR
jgi:hypothetical protein